ncbi:MAG: ATP-dependent DNA helicase RecG [Anaerolineae bacterium]|nr:RecQ family ATP-dependent DNA helicase [Anaerolineales bacterium]MCQ3973563.1 ATP-dependent DNA helicase RecG [Anaerolineae bacterium]
MPLSDLQSHALKLLKQALDNPQITFRDGQWEAIEYLIQQRARLLVVQRTGWGKSIVYFLSTRILRDQGSGPTIVISPLLALIRNQIQAAERLGLQAATINSDNKADWPDLEMRFRNNQIDVLLISPERLANEKFREETLGPAMAQLGLGLLVVDEAHCISDWGHDFRPDYRRIVRIVQALPPNVPILATTATANNRVVEDIKIQFGADLKILRGPLTRKSLRLQNIELPNRAERMAWLAHYLPKLPGSGIIYTLTRKDAQRLARWLQTNNIEADAYYSGKDEGASRTDLEQALLNNQLKVIVATTALGMGFDKPDLGFVIHFQRPSSVVHYYQQVGRAGRAVDLAYGILLGGEEDNEITDYFIQNALPPESHTEVILKALDEADGLSVNELQRVVNLPRTQIDKVLKLLSVETPTPVEKRGSLWHRTPVAYAPDRQKVAKLTAIRYTEQKQMTEYLRSQSCLMQYLQVALDDPSPQPCGYCAACRGRPIISEKVDPTDVQAALRFLQEDYPVIEPRKQWPGANTFPIYGWTGRIDRDLQAEEGRALCKWGDPGWGDLVREGKQQMGHFSQVLVNAALTLLEQHWQPIPYPTWVTCVPSLNNPKLVADFTERLARALRLPFQPCIHKTKSTQPQKAMQNSYQQAQNLDGAFTVTVWSGISGPVLLIDDMVDSRWTMTIVAVLLRQAGSGPVYPLALADTSRGEV